VANLGEEVTINDLATGQSVITYVIDGVGPAQCNADHNDERRRSLFILTLAGFHSVDTPSAP